MYTRYKRGLHNEKPPRHSHLGAPKAPSVAMLITLGALHHDHERIQLTSIHWPQLWSIVKRICKGRSCSHSMASGSYILSSCSFRPLCNEKIVSFTLHFFVCAVKKRRFSVNSQGSARLASKKKLVTLNLRIETLYGRFDL